MLHLLALPPSRRTKSSSMNDITPDSTALTSSPSETPIDLDIQALAQQYPWLEGLNPPQMAAATQTTGAVLVLAGAGTGKTRALTTRLAHLLLTGQARPQEILAVTFTNKAAAEMKHRVEAMINHPTEGGFWALSTHSRHEFCAFMQNWWTSSPISPSSMMMIKCGSSSRSKKQGLRSEALSATVGVECHQSLEG